jgi:hypothetical protein
MPSGWWEETDICYSKGKKIQVEVDLNVMRKGG